MKNKKDRSKIGKETQEAPALPQTTTGETPDCKSEEKSSEEAAATQTALLVNNDAKPVESPEKKTSSDDSATNKTYHSLVDGDILSNYKEARSPSSRVGIKKIRSLAKLPLDLERQSSLNGALRERFESFNIP